MSDVITGEAAAGSAGASTAAAPDGNGLGTTAPAAQPMSGSAGIAGGVSAAAGTSSAASELGRVAAAVAPAPEVVLETRDVNVFYGDNHALHNTSLAFHKGEITALIGPSGCGKSTFLRSLNLMNREIRGCRVEGEILYGGRNVNTREENLYELRRSIGMVFQQPNPFHKTIYENIVFAPKRHGLRGKDNLDALVEESLRGAALWDEVKDKLHQSAFSLSGGQQQRLCIARTLAMHPDVILFDEPCSALDPISPSPSRSSCTPWCATAPS